MKVLLLSPLPPPCGGIATWTRNLLDYFQNGYDGYELIHLDTASRRIITDERLLTRIWYGVMETVSIIRKMTKILRKEDPDVVHLTSSASLALIKDLLIVIIAGRKGLPVVTHWRFGRIPDLAVRKNTEWRLLTMVIRYSSFAIVLDNKSKTCLDNVGLNNVAVVPNPAGPRLFNNLKVHDKEEYPRIHGQVIYAGHLVKGKGVRELVEACSSLSVVEKLCLIGPGDQNMISELNKVAAKRGDGKWLNICGELKWESVNEYLHSSELFVLPSYSEGFPNVLLEAMSAACPVLASDVGAIPDIVGADSESPGGICIPPADVEALRMAIVQMLADSEMLRSMGNNGRRRVIEKFSMYQISNQYKGLWKEVLATGKKHPVLITG